MEKNGYNQRIYILEIKPVRRAIGFTVWNQGKESRVSFRLTRCLESASKYPGAGGGGWVVVKEKLNGS